LARLHEIELLLISQEAKPKFSQKRLLLTLDYEIINEEYVDMEIEETFSSNRGWNGKCSFTLKGRNFIVGSCTKTHYNHYWEVEGKGMISFKGETDMSMSYAVCSSFSDDRAMVCNPWWVSDSKEYNGCLIFDGNSWTNISKTNYNHGLSGSLVSTKKKNRTSNTWTAIYGL